MKLCTATLIDIDGKSKVIENAEFDSGSVDLQIGAEGKASGNLESARVMLPEQIISSLQGFDPVHVRIQFDERNTQLWDVAKNFWRGSLADIPLTK